MVEGRPDVPLGGDFLRVVKDQERRCEETFDEWIPTAGVMAPQTMEALGTALSYLDRIATCWWGCRQGPHVEERMIGRVSSNARVALLGMRSGYYDEVLGLIRQIGKPPTSYACSSSLPSCTRSGMLRLKKSYEMTSFQYRSE